MGKYLLSVLIVASAGIALAQSSNQSTANTYRTDINGNRIFDSTTSTAGNSRTERVQNLNGRSVPLEQVEEKVLRDDASGKVVERNIRRFDANGKPGPLERVTISETKRSDGSTLTETSVLRGDLNGNLAPAERSRIETRKSGDSSVSEVVIERPSLSGNFELTEKRSLTTVESPNKKQESTTIYVRDTNGNFIETRKDVREAVKSGASTVENSATYEQGDNGQLRLAKQEAKTTVKNPDGSESTQLNVYSRPVGQVDSPDAPPQLKEQQTIERRPTADGIVETVVVRDASPRDPNRLGAARKVSETLCKGKCSDK